MLLDRVSSRISINFAAHYKAHRGLCEADYRGSEEEEKDEERPREEARWHRRGGGCRGRLLSVLLVYSLSHISSISTINQLSKSIQALEKGEEEVEEDSDDESEEEDDDTPGEKSFMSEIQCSYKDKSPDCN